MEHLKYFFKSKDGLMIESQETINNDIDLLTNKLYKISKKYNITVSVYQLLFIIVSNITIFPIFFLELLHLWKFNKLVNIVILIMLIFFIANIIKIFYIDHQIRKLESIKEIILPNKAFYNNNKYKRFLFKHIPIMSSIIYRNKSWLYYLDKQITDVLKFSNLANYKLNCESNDISAYNLDPFIAYFCKQQKINIEIRNKYFNSLWIFTSIVTIPLTLTIFNKLNTAFLITIMIYIIVFSLTIFINLYFKINKDIKQLFIINSYKISQVQNLLNIYQKLHHKIKWQIIPKNKNS